MHHLCCIDSDGVSCSASVALTARIGTVGIAFLAAIATIAAGTPGTARAAANDAQSMQFSASPTSGPAPLTVKFCASAGISIDFGDGTSSGMGGVQDGDCPAGLSSYTSHTYTRPGVYRLRGSPCPGSALHPACAEAASQAGMISIIVTGSR